MMESAEAILPSLLETKALPSKAVDGDSFPDGLAHVNL